jgi:hypothetical protein
VDLLQCYLALRFDYLEEKIENILYNNAGQQIRIRNCVGTSRSGYLFCCCCHAGNWFVVKVCMLVPNGPAVVQTNRRFFLMEGEV